MGLYKPFLDSLAALEGLEGTEPPAGAQTVRSAIQALSDVPAGARDIRVYELRPHGDVELPALWNWFPDSGHDLIATDMGEEMVNVNVRIGIRHTTADQELALLTAYADAFIDVIDPFLHQQTQALGPAGLVQEAIRSGMRTRVDQFGDTPVLCAEFPIRARIRRPISA